VLCVAIDSEGRPLAIDTGWLQLLPAGATAVVECSFFDPPANAAGSRIYVNISNLTLFSLDRE
jgi:hypothetical protein